LGGITPKQYSALLKFDISPSVFSLENAKILSSLAVDAEKQVKAHIAIDTGMSRTGFLPEEWECILEIAKLPNIEIEGLFTHYATADERDKSRALVQLDKFIKLEKKLSERGLDIPYKHISNSAGIIEFDSPHFNIVRMGIMLYGLYPSDEVDKDFGLKPAMALKTRIIHTKTLASGCQVGYGATYITNKDTRIATLPIGYADGYPRAMSSQGRVIIKGEYAPVIGRVCMDQIMVDVTNISCFVGDIATVMGESGGKLITAEEIGAASISFNYEIVCRVGIRVPRIYIKDGKYFKKVDYLA
ncbi:MAG: alanine racemase, partial [Clostridia bacterium]